MYSVGFNPDIPHLTTHTFEFIQSKPGVNLLNGMHNNLDMKELCLFGALLFSHYS